MPQKTDDSAAGCKSLRIVDCEFVICGGEFEDWIFTEKDGAKYCVERCKVCGHVLTLDPVRLSDNSPKRSLSAGIFGSMIQY